MQHLDEGTIHAWLDGALSADEAARVELHVASCETCSDAVAEARGLIAASSRILTALDDVPRVSTARWGRRDRGDRRPFLIRWRIAAVIALVVGGGALALSVARDSIPTLALQSTAERENSATLAALDSPAADMAEQTPPPNAEAPALLRGDGAPSRSAVGAAAGRTPVRSTVRGRDLSAPPADSAAMNLAQVDVPTAAAPPPSAPAHTDDTVRLPSAATAEARVTTDTARLADRSSVTEKLAGALGARRSVADASARFAEPAASQARALPAPEPNAPRLLTEERITEADGRVVVRRVYHVEETLVTLDERAPPERELERQEQVVAQERLQRLEERVRRIEERPAPTVPTATIRWIDARGAEFTLSGQVPREQLERFRKLLGH